jgi:hypothetical protein
MVFGIALEVDARRVRMAVDFERVEGDLLSHPVRGRLDSGLTLDSRVQARGWYQGDDADSVSLVDDACSSVRVEKRSLDPRGIVLLGRSRPLAAVGGRAPFPPASFDALTVTSLDEIAGVKKRGVGSMKGPRSGPFGDAAYRDLAPEAWSYVVVGQGLAFQRRDGSEVRGRLVVARPDCLLVRDEGDRPQATRFVDVRLESLRTWESAPRSPVDALVAHSKGYRAEGSDKIWGVFDSTGRLTLPDQGFEFHVVAGESPTSTVARRLLVFLEERGVAHRVLAPRPGAAGNEFQIVAYAGEAPRAVALARELEGALAKARPSRLAWRWGRPLGRGLVTVRYVPFTARHEGAIVGADGRARLSPRAPRWRPEWMAGDPFESAFGPFEGAFGIER